MQVKSRKVSSFYSRKRQDDCIQQVVNIFLHLYFKLQNIRSFGHNCCQIETCYTEQLLRQPKLVQQQSKLVKQQQCILGKVIALGALLIINLSKFVITIFEAKIRLCYIIMLMLVKFIYMNHVKLVRQRLREGPDGSILSGHK
ncbi:Hypothetical_protein [Hexamita inflata]|nr:Hypothetical protein HINF_LOCUS49269 [Hexamita inflata]